MDAGLTNLQAIQASMIKVAKPNRAEKELGVVAPGFVLTSSASRRTR